MVLRLVLHLAGWLAAVAAAVLFVCLIEMAPLDPRPGTALAPKTQRSLLVYSPAGRAGRAYVDEEQKLHGQLQTLLPAGILAFTDTNAKTAGFATLLGALAQAEDRALDEPCRIPAYRARYEVDASFPEEPVTHQDDLYVYPTWDLPEVIQQSREQGGVARWFVSMIYEDEFETSSWPGAVVVWGFPGAQELVHLMLAAIRREQAGLTPAPDTVPPAAQWQDYEYVAAIFTGHFDSLQGDKPGVFLEDFERIGYAAGMGRSVHMVMDVGGWFICSGRLDALEEYIQVFNDSRLIRAVHQMRRPSQAGVAACQAALWDDDPLLGKLAMLRLAKAKAHTLNPLAGDLLRMAPHPADLSRGQWEGRAGGLLAPFSPAEAAQHVSRIARTTVDADLMEYLLLEALGSEHEEVRRAAADGLLARLPRGATQLLRQRARPERLPPAEREAFLAALVDRLLAELATDNWERAVFITVQGLALADEGFVPPSSPARSRLTELGGWLVLHPTMSKSFREGPGNGVTAAVCERIRDCDPEVRQEVWYILRHDFLPHDELGPLLGDPFTGGRPKPSRPQDDCF